MSTLLFDLSTEPLPLRLLRVRQIREQAIEPLLSETNPFLEFPMRSEGERAASAERLLHARRRLSQ